MDFLLTRLKALDFKCILFFQEWQNSFPGGITQDKIDKNEKSEISNRKYNQKIKGRPEEYQVISKVEIKAINFYYFIHDISAFVLKRI